VGLLTCIVLVAVLTPTTSAFARPKASAATAWKECPYIFKDLTGVFARHVSCHVAEKVARRYMAIPNLSGPKAHRVLGFRCTVVWVGHPRSDWYASCRKGRALVRAIPE
jgi:hypothetical protein